MRDVLSHSARGPCAGSSPQRASVRRPGATASGWFGAVLGALIGTGFVYLMKNGGDPPELSLILWFTAPDVKTALARARGMVAERRASPGRASGC